MEINLEVIKRINEIRLQSGFERVRVRQRCEDMAIAIIQENPGELTYFLINWFMDLVDIDFLNGSHIFPDRDPRTRRFGSLFGARNMDLILENDIDILNNFFLDIYWFENIDKADEYISQLNGVKEGFVSLLLYLKNRQEYNVMLPKTIEGIKVIFPREASKISGSFAQKYSAYNKLVNRLRRICNLYPQEVDYILTSIAEENNE